jgi:hypothetical protein
MTVRTEQNTLPDLRAQRVERQRQPAGAHPEPLVGRLEMVELER